MEYNYQKGTSYYLRQTQNNSAPYTPVFLGLNTYENRYKQIYSVTFGLWRLVDMTVYMKPAFYIEKTLAK